MDQNLGEQIKTVSRSTRSTKPKAIIFTRADGTEVEYPSGMACAAAEKFKQTRVSEMARKGLVLHGCRARFK